MIAVLRKNLGRLISKHNSFVCKAHVSFSLRLHFFSTPRERKPVALVASDLGRFRSAEKRAESILVFLKESGFSSAQLEKILKYKLRRLSVESIKFKIKIFQELGLSSKDIAKVVSNNPVILHLSATNKIIPSLSLLRGLLGSNDDVSRLLRKSPWFPAANLGNTLVPNVEFLKICGTPMAYIIKFLYIYPRFLLIKPDTMRRSADKAKALGFSQRSKSFMYAARIIASMSEGAWQVKLQAFRDLGFSDSVTLTMFRKAPQVFCVSLEKIEKVKELLLATGKFNMSSIADCPTPLGCSIEKRLKPRLQILGVLEGKNLIGKWPSLSRISVLSDAKFCERYISPYSNELGQVYVTKSYVKGKES